MSVLDKLQAWVSRHRTEVAIGVGVVVVGVAAAALLSGSPSDASPSLPSKVRYGGVFRYVAVRWGAAAGACHATHSPHPPLALFAG